MSDVYGVRPSTILNLEDEYTSYCFDEACAYILLKMKDGDKPVFVKKDNRGSNRKHFSRMSDVYSSMGFGLKQYTKYDN